MTDINSTSFTRGPAPFSRLKRLQPFQLPHPPTRVNQLRTLITAVL
jgi:hypothetical protein